MATFSFSQRSPRERMWIIGGALAALVMLMIGWLLLISPQRADTDAVNAEADTVRASNVQLQSRISSLRAESKDMRGVAAKLASAQQALPSASGLSDFLRSLQSLGSSTGTDVVSLSVGAPTDVSSVAAPSSSATPSSPKPAQAAQAAGHANGVFGLTITAQVNGSTARLDRFLDQLQTAQPRAVLVTQITQSSIEAGSSLQLTMQAFVAPSTAAEQARLAQATNR